MRCEIATDFARCMPACGRPAHALLWRRARQPAHAIGTAPMHATVAVHLLGGRRDDERSQEPTMALARVHSRALRGLEAPAVPVEVHLANGLPSFTLVGLGDTEVRESRERVRTCCTISPCAANRPPGERSRSPAGQLNLLMVGRPDSGNSMLARRLAGLLPPLARGGARIRQRS